MSAKIPCCMGMAARDDCTCSAGPVIARSEAIRRMVAAEAERDVLEAIVARVEALADEWAAMGCDSSDDTHPPTPSRMCPSCASADLHAACADEREWRVDEEDR